VLLVILGAGASYDSNRSQSLAAPDQRPPLAKDLFSPRFAEVARTYDAVQGILEELRHASNVEQALEDLLAQRDRYPRRIRQLLGATYYIRQVIDNAETEWWSRSPDHVTNYVDLVEQLDSWTSDSKESVAFITFNYDTLLEKGIHAVIGKSFRNLDDYITEPMPVFKLHGSVNWWEFVVNPGWGDNLASVQWADRMLEAATGLQRMGTYQVRAAHEFAGAPVIPAISLPVITKGDDAFACPTSHLEALRALLPIATKVLVIGWRGAEAHFYKLWKDSYRAGQGGPRAMMIVDRDSGIVEVGTNLRTSAQWLPFAHSFPGGFSELLNGDELRPFLKL
jgi:hypothetical protein